jgi:hypothetical protein
MKQPIEVVMLPTEDSTFGSQLKNTIYEHSENKSLVIGYLNARSTKHVPQHVYVTVSQDIEAIEVGDWFYNPQFNVISHRNDVAIKTHKGCRKIIATTDPKLCTTKQNGQLGQAIIRPIGIQQSFIEEFAGNPNGEYFIEYEDEVNPLKSRRTLSSFAVAKVIEQAILGINLKLNQDNEVSITSVSKCDCPPAQACRICGEKKDLDGDFWKNLPPVKEKMYSKSEVIQMIWDLHNGVLNGDELKWIKENLKPN